jgi:sigma-B regulation protein RsbU (phosphoserine phosphatase)
MDDTVPSIAASIPRILVAEDEPGIALGLADTLHFEGYEVEVVTNGVNASRRALEQSFDLILLDVMLPGKDGFEICREVRCSGLQTPIIFLTARAVEADRVAGLNLGANDYVTKPFSPLELIARVRGLLRFVEHSQRDRRRLEGEVQAASQVQQRLFPALRPAIPGLDYAGACRAARGVSGDYYDFIELPSGRLAILLADVCGKGMPAALLGASLHAAVRAYAPDAGSGCGDLLARVNRWLFETTAAERFVTAFYAVYDPRDRSLTWANAGHCPPLLLRRQSSSITRLNSLTPPAGMFPAIRPAQRTLWLNPGDRLLVFSDGITEARNVWGEEFGDERLEALLRDQRDLSAAQVCDAILAQVMRFARGCPQSDDLTLVATRVGTGSALTES